MNQKILVADDEVDMLHLVSMNLRGAGFTALTVEDGPGVISKARDEHPALILLDLMLPGMSGLEVCRAIKSNPDTAEIPIIMLTAKSEEIDRIVGLELGADDYITKPFSPRELILRVKSVLRRNSKMKQPRNSLNLGSISVDKIKHEVRVENAVIDLTHTEFKLLVLLLERRGRVQSRERLLNEVWGYESLIDSRTVDTHIRRLREKLGAAAALIETVRGVGYRSIEKIAHFTSPS